MTVRIDKYDALGNDFLVLDLAQVGSQSTGVSGGAAAAADRASGASAPRQAPDWPAIARAWCSRTTGAGADGLLLLTRNDDVEARMQLFNSDGSSAEMSGNGARCFAHSLYRADAARGERSYRLHTAAGIRQVTVGAQASSGVHENADTVIASVDMGEVQPIAEPAGWSAIGTHPDRPVMHLSVGNPHTVVGVEDVHDVDLLTLGRKVPQVNLEVVAPGPERNGITMRVHERGAGLTQACGTGACASAWAAVWWGLVPQASERVEVVVHMPGGDAVVLVNAPSVGRTTLTGSSQFVGSFDASLDSPFKVTAR
ncbi:MAG: diaminopimelate epimerase [Ilumatobacteraceae bacterium]